MLKSIGAQVEQRLVPHNEYCYIKVNATSNIEPMLNVIISRKPEYWSNDIQQNDGYLVRIGVFVHGETIIPQPSETGHEIRSSVKKIRRRKFKDGDKAAKYIADYCDKVAKVIRDAVS